MGNSCAEGVMPGSCYRAFGIRNSQYRIEVRMRAQVSIIVLITCTFLTGQTRAQSGARSTTNHPTSASQAATRVQIYGDTWYDFLLRQFNPDNLDRGAWLEQRRQILLDATARNSFFKYSLVVTVLLLVAMGCATKCWCDLKRIRWIHAAQLADVLSQDRQSREAAREAIRQHNDHIEKCNRVIEVQEAGLSLSTPAANSEAAALRAELQQTGDDLSTVKRERDQLRAELDQTRTSVADLSLRVESLARKGNGQSTSADGPAGVNTTNNADLVRHINTLQQQLHYEKEKNKRLKGG